MKKPRQLSLIGDRIENAFNIEAMVHAAEMFGANVAFREPAVNVEELKIFTVDDIRTSFSHRLAMDNLANSQTLYGFELPENARAAIIAGNERRGISKEVTNIATQAISIPMMSRQLNCINVAAASAVALYYLSYGHRGKLQIRKDPQKKRPELLLIGGQSHAELGSAIRSAAAFGWARTFLEDRHNVWFGCDRITKSEGRAAARRGRNTIKLVPCQRGNDYLFDEAVIVTTKALGTPLPQADLCRGINQVIVIPDESSINVEDEDWSRVAANYSFAQIETSTSLFTYHFRHTASIALAEASRQVGVRASGRPAKQRQLYENTLRLLAEEQGEEVDVSELMEY